MSDDQPKISDPDAEELAERLDQEIGQLATEGERVDKQVSKAREDWERKRADPGVPGAPPSDTA